MSKIKHIHRNRTFSLLLTKVSIEALDVLTAETKRVKSLKENAGSCGCQLRTSCGLPCACEISQYVDADVSIPLHTIDVFWKKLDFEPALSKQEGPNEPDDPKPDLRKHLQDFEDAYHKERAAVVKRSWLQKMRVIWDLSSTTYDEPGVQTKACGRPSTKPKHPKKPNLGTAKPPLQRTYSHKPPRHSSYAVSTERDYAQELTRHSSFRYSQDQEHPTPSSLMDYEDSPGYNSAFVNYETTGFFPVNHDDYPGYNSAYVNTAEQTYYTNPSSVIDDFFGFNENTAEQRYFTNTSSVPEYDFMGLSQHNVTSQKSQDYHTYIGQIPEIFHPYVEDIKTVDGDGNCGFRATTVALGYDQDDWPLIRRLLIDEMVQFKKQYKKAFNDKSNQVDEYNIVLKSLDRSGDGFVPHEYWMIMPETGFFIANKFNVIFHFISIENDSSATLFPLWT